MRTFCISKMLTYLLKQLILTFTSYNSILQNQKLVCNSFGLPPNAVYFHVIFLIFYNRYHMRETFSWKTEKSLQSFVRLIMSAKLFTPKNSLGCIGQFFVKVSKLWHVTAFYWYHSLRLNNLFSIKCIMCLTMKCNFARMHKLSSSFPRIGKLLGQIYFDHYWTINVVLTTNSNRIHK